MLDGVGSTHTLRCNVALQSLLFLSVGSDFLCFSPLFRVPLLHSFDIVCLVDVSGNRLAEYNMRTASAANKTA